MKLELKHRIWADGDEFCVEESYDDISIVWRVPTRWLADQLVAERQQMYEEFVRKVCKELEKALDL
jgi:hypothetical protein